MVQLELGSWKTNWDSSWNVTPTLRIEDYEEALPLFLEPVLAWFFLQKSGIEARERNMILADKQHQVRMTRGYFPQHQLQRDRNSKRPERKCVICDGPHWASQCPEKQRKPSEKKGETTAHTPYGEFSMAVHTEKSMFAKETLETRKVLIDCGATNSMGSWEALDGLARMNEQRHGSTRFSRDRTKKTWYTFANGTRQQSEGEVPFKGDAFTTNFEQVTNFKDFKQLHRF